MENYKVGGTLGYTRGQYKDVANKWHELNSFAVAPMKGTLFAEWDNNEGYGVRVQMQAIVKLLYYSYKIRKKLEITHRLSRSTILTLTFNPCPHLFYRI